MDFQKVKEENKFEKLFREIKEDNKEIKEINKEIKEKLNIVEDVIEKMLNFYK
jgi:hypothetical protein